MKDGVIMSKNLSEYTKNELIQMINSLKSFKKFGLVWEDKPEEVALLCQKKLPVIKEIEKLSVKNSEDDLTNIIIEGDNFHALSVLNYTHSGKFDVIYADPPYNTGSKNWKYNNAFVDENDAFKHSKWISFMDKRLRLAKNLLNDDGVIIVTIDDYEIENLTLLMNQIFGEANHMGTVVIKNNPQGRSLPTGFQISHEYALFYSLKKKKIGTLPRNAQQIARYNEKDSLGPFEWRNFRAQYSQESESMVYPIFVKKDCSDFRIPQLEWDNEKNQYTLLEQPLPDEIITYPEDENGRMRTWKWSIDTALANKKDHMGVRLDRSGTPAVYYKGRMTNDGMQPYTIWDNPKYSASTFGNNILEDILGSKKFEYPKSVYAVMDCIKVACDKTNAKVLDFFAGSGTTGHAVLKLNDIDGGTRSFVLCTNNENNICSEVTYPRIKTVITGKREDGSTYIEETKDLLFDQELNISMIKDSTDLFDGIARIRKDNRPYYSSIKSVIEDNSIRLYGIPKEQKVGLTGNVRYFRTAFVEKDETLDKLRKVLSPACEDMIRVRENSFEKIVDEDLLKVYQNSRGLTAIIFDKYELEQYINVIEDIPTNSPVHLYVFSYSKSTRPDEMPEHLHHKYESQPIPEGVLEIYKKIFGKQGDQ